MRSYPHLLTYNKVNEGLKKIQWSALSKKGLWWLYGENFIQLLCCSLRIFLFGALYLFWRRATGCNIFQILKLLRLSLWLIPFLFYILRLVPGFSNIRSSFLWYCCVFKGSSQYLPLPRDFWQQATFLLSTGELKVTIFCCRGVSVNSACTPLRTCSCHFFVGCFLLRT